MKIRVTKSRHWYEVGEVYTVLGGKVVDYYRVDHPKNTGTETRIVEEDDCEVISEEAVELENAKVTVLKDATLGGIEREYAEVKRKARVGESIMNTFPTTDLPVGYITQVTGVSREGIAECVDIAGDNRKLAEHRYVVLEQTAIVHVNGERLRLVYRAASVGERIIVWKTPWHDPRFKAGEIYEVVHVNSYGSTYVNHPEGTYVANGGARIDHECYRVLEPASYAQKSTQPATEPSTPSITDLFAITDGLTDAVAKLTRKITEMETRLDVAKTVDVPAAVTEPSVPKREPKLGDRVVIVDARVTNIGRSFYLTEGPAYHITEIDDCKYYPFNIAKVGEQVGIWCSRDAFVLADEEVAAPKALTRDDVIERAKADVAKLERTNRVMCVPTVHGGEMSFYPRGGGNGYNSCDGVKYVVDREKRTVIALIHWLDEKEKVWARGIAKAATGDVFNSHIGRAIALRRALGLPVPAEYTNAPQPSEPRVGDIVIYHSKVSGDHVTTLTKRAPQCDGSTFGKYAFYHTAMDGWIADKQYTLVDDSREEVAE